MNKRTCILLLILTVLSIASYFPTLQNDFLYYWDDQWQVTNEYTSGGWTLQNLSTIFCTFNGGQYSPVNQIMYIFIYTLFGYNAVAFHAMSLIIHIFNASLVYILVLKLTRTIESKRAEFMAFFTALLFAIHPINVESIAWISASKIPMYTFFYLLGLLAYLKYITTIKTKWFVVTLICFILSFGCKEQSVTFPLCLVVIDYFMRRNTHNNLVGYEKLPFFILALFFGMVTILAQGPASGSSDYPLWQRTLFSCYALFEYITKILLPLRLNYLYPFPMDAGETIPIRFWIYPLLFVGLVCLTVVYRKNRLIMFCLLFFAVHQFLSLNIISLGRFAMIADRYLYISEIGLFLIIADIVDSIFKCIKRKKHKQILTIVTVLYLLYLSCYTNLYTHKWKNSDSVKQYLNEMAYKNTKKGDLSEKTVVDEKNN